MVIELDFKHEATILRARQLVSRVWQGPCVFCHDGEVLVWKWQYVRDLPPLLFIFPNASCIFMFLNP